MRVHGFQDTIDWYDENTAVVADTLSKHERFFRYYTQAELDTMLKKAGFRVLETGYKGDQHGRKEVQWLEFIAKRP